ncbi:MAG: helix-turn-helix domain-containing protein [Planctomycetes bacterium]|nr:helix-turn-helix domain-containing protein [Planctomycetota bacterium]
MHRKRSGLSQHEVAVLLGCQSGAKVSRYECGDRVPLLPDILALEIIYRAPARDLFAKTFDVVAPKIKGRAQKLSRDLDAQPFTPVIKRKMSSLVKIIYQQRRDQAA